MRRLFAKGPPQTPVPLQHSAQFLPHASVRADGRSFLIRLASDVASPVRAMSKVVWFHEKAGSRFAGSLLPVVKEFARQVQGHRRQRRARFEYLNPASRVGDRSTTVDGVL